MNEQKARTGTEFGIPTREILQAANRIAKSQNHSERIVAKALLDLLKVALPIRNALKSAGLPDAQNQRLEISPYLDFSCGNALGVAGRLKNSTKKQHVRSVAASLLKMNECRVSNRERYLRSLPGPGTSVDAP